MPLLTVSVPVMVWGPLVFSVELAEPIPLERVMLPGRLAAPSLEVNFTVPR